MQLVRRNFTPQSFELAPARRVGAPVFEALDHLLREQAAYSGSWQLASARRADGEFLVALLAEYVSVHALEDVSPFGDAHVHRAFRQLVQALLHFEHPARELSFELNALNNGC